MGDAYANRLRWRCRRGMKELDVLLERYLRSAWATAGAAERAAFARLVELPDPELAALCFGRTATADPALAAVVTRLTRGERVDA